MDHLLKNLTALIMSLNRPDIQTVDALLAKMLGDHVAGRMLARLLYWFPRSVKGGGWVYKSWRDWDAECALSPAQVKRIHHAQLLEAFGIIRKRMKANGAPTTHYRLDLELFLTKLAEFLELTIEQIRAFFSGVAQPRPAQPPAQDVPPPQAQDDSDKPVPFLPNPPPPEATPAPDDSPRIGPMSAREWWLAFTNQMQLQLDPSTYGQLFRRAEFVTYEASTARWTIAVPHELAQRTLQGRWYRDIRQWLVNLTSTACELRFEVRPPER